MLDDQECFSSFPAQLVNMSHHDLPVPLDSRRRRARPGALNRRQTSESWDGEHLSAGRWRARPHNCPFPASFPEEIEQFQGLMIFHFPGRLPGDQEVLHHCHLGENPDQLPCSSDAHSGNLIRFEVGDIPIPKKIPGRCRPCETR